jgi:hypothetical protein
MNFGFSQEELSIIRPWNTPRKIQDFINAIPMNFKPDTHTCRSPRVVLRDRTAHCIEGAMLAAAMLRVAGWKPLVMDLRAAPYDYDHVVALFRIDGHWGAISKTNHGVLRYREAIYKSVRELAVSYFHEYHLDKGEKTLRSYSGAIDLSRFDTRGWMTAEEQLTDVYAYIDSVRHYPFLTRAQLSRLRPADKIEREMGKLAEWPNPRRRKA